VWSKDLRCLILMFFLGAASLQLCSSLPRAELPVWLLLLSLLSSLWWPPARLVLLFLLGFGWAWLHADARLAARLPAELQGRTLSIEGQVIGLPESSQRRTRFLFRVDRAWRGQRALKSPGRLRLGWYQRRRKIAVGEYWRLQVRLKRPHGFMNPGGYDYEGWLFSHAIQATGYVRGKGDNRRLSPPRGQWLNRVRAAINQVLRRHFDDRRTGAFIRALVTGDRQGLGSAEWRVLRDTGTAHLLAISGLHIGLLAALGYLLGRWLWSLSPWLCGRWPAQYAGALGAMLLALAYAALSGFAVPAQRALVMVCVAMLGLFHGRRASHGHVLALALLLVLLLDPLTPMLAGFWLSFGAVALILYGMDGRVAARGWWWRWGRVQFLLLLGLSPLLLWLFARAPLVSPLVNLFAVPWVTIATVPLALAGIALWPLSATLAGLLLDLSGTSLQGLWGLLQWFAQGGFNPILHQHVSVWGACFALPAVLVLLMPAGLPGRWLGLVLLLPLLLPRQQGVPAVGVFRLSVLDVGQGLATVVETRRHVLVFDTGPRYGPDFDAGGAVIVPYLRQRGHAAVDAVVVSHVDADHSGGLRSLLAAYRPLRLWWSRPGELTLPGGRFDTAVCRRGRAWWWDGVHFEFVHPPRDYARSRNNRSCVLRVDTGAHAVLLPGDLELPGERDLVLARGGGLRADVLVAGHHGSRTSSGEAFLRRVRPRWVVFSTGYRNYLHFPHAEVVRRLRARRVGTLNTASDGAIVFVIGPAGVSAPLRYRLQAGRFWNDSTRHRAGHRPMPGASTQGNESMPRL